MANWWTSAITNEAVVIGLGGAIGANARYWLGRWISSLSWGEHFPWGTVIANVSGSMLLAAFFVLLTEKFTAPQKGWLLFLGTGFCGSYTTFSTFGVETFKMLEQGRYGAALGYVVVSVLAGFMAVAVTFWALRGGLPNPPADGWK